MTILRELTKAPPEVRGNFLHRVGQMAFFDGLIALLLFACAGSLDWSFAWLYTVLMILIQLVGAFFMPLEVLAERGSKKRANEKWDKLLTRLLLLAFLSLYLVAGLDFRWRWSMELSTAWHLAGVLLFILGSSLEMWAMRTNRFFSTGVRIQAERGHKVCSSGPYKSVRHPGYAGMIIYIGFSPVFLGTLWGFIPAFLTSILFIARTRLEDKTLQDKLPGYKEYAARVRYRLVPGVW
jgi:protein-S-isoprenylcysteine O-methyltransferase Ste14